MRLRALCIIFCVSSVLCKKPASVVISNQIYSLQKSLNALYEAVDPFTAYKKDALYLVLSRLKTRDHDMYVLLQKAYRVLEQAYGKPQKLSDLPIFTVLADRKVKNVLAYGKEVGRGSAKGRKKARSRFKMMVALVAYADQIGRDVTAIPKSSEERNPKTCVAYLTDQDDTWWDVDLQRFEQVVAGDTSQLVSVLDRILRRINAQDAPMAFQLHVFPAFLENLAREESQQFRQQLVDYVDIQEVVQKTLQEQMQEAQQLEQQLIQPDEPKTPAPEPEQRSQLLDQIRSGATLRKTQEAAPDEKQLERKPREPQKAPWWQDRLEQFRERMADDMKKENIEAFISVVNEMLKYVGPLPEAATDWFKTNIFDNFLKIMEDEGVLKGFVNMKDAHKIVRQYMESLWKVQSKDEINRTQAIQFNSFQSEGKFKDAFDVMEES